VVSCAYLAAVYLAADAARDGEEALEADFRLRALGAGVVAGAAAIAGIFIVNADRHSLYHSLLSGRALPAVIVSFLAGLATLALVYGRRFEPARYSAALAVAAIVAGWALARWPTILPGLTVDQAAAGHDALVWVIVCVLAGGAVLFPSLGLLFRLTVTGRLQGGERRAAERSAGQVRDARSPLLARSAIALLIAGFGLLNVAEAGWAHAVGVACLLAFMVLGFRVLVFAALDASESTR
jgi:cytochrome d ubiquinol oxidase subunit II